MCWPAFRMLSGRVSVNCSSRCIWAVPRRMPSLPISKRAGTRHRSEAIRLPRVAHRCFTSMPRGASRDYGAIKPFGGFAGRAGCDRLVADAGRCGVSEDPYPNSRGCGRLRQFIMIRHPACISFSAIASLRAFRSRRLWGVTRASGRAAGRRRSTRQRIQSAIGFTVRFSRR